MSGLTGSEPGTPHRRRDDLTGSEAMLAMVEFLMTRPTCEQICQQLVLSVLARHEPREAVIALFGANGSLHTIGQMGSSRDLQTPPVALSLWATDPMADAVRTGEPVIVSEGERQQRYRHSTSGHEDGTWLVAWPLSLPNQRVGAVQLTFAGTPDVNELRADLTGIAAVLALYLSLLTSIAAVPDRALEIMGSTDATTGFAARELSVLHQAHSSSHQVPDHLSERQQQILQFMAAGMTNSQIAKRIGFSESTVRQETMVIYRFFGVGGRQDAVRVARSRELLAPE